MKLIAKALPKIPTLSLAFNKRIAEEMKTRLPSHVLSATINSIGHRIWMAATSKRLVLNTRKSYELLKENIDGLSRNDKDDAYDKFSDTLRAIGLAKASGYIPDGKFPTIERLISADDFFSSLEEEVRADLLDASNSPVDQARLRWQDRFR